MAILPFRVDTAPLAPPATRIFPSSMTSQGFRMQVSSSQGRRVLPETAANAAGRARTGGVVAAHRVSGSIPGQLPVGLRYNTTTSRSRESKQLQPGFAAGTVGNFIPSPIFSLGTSASSQRAAWAPAFLGGWMTTSVLPAQTPMEHSATAT